MLMTFVMIMQVVVLMMNGGGIKVMQAIFGCDTLLHIINPKP